MYLDEVATGLRGPRRRRARILAELRDGLDEAWQSTPSAGLPADQAATAATVRFGDPTVVAQAFAAELAIA